MDVADIIIEDFLYQNAFTSYDYFCPLTKSVRPLYHPFHGPFCNCRSLLILHPSTVIAPLPYLDSPTSLNLPVSDTSCITWWTEVNIVVT